MLGVAGSAATQPRSMHTSEVSIQSVSLPVFACRMMCSHTDTLHLCQTCYEPAETEVLVPEVFALACNTCLPTLLSEP